MTKLKKTVIALSVVCVVILLSLISVVVAWAASNQSMTSQLTVNYHAYGVNMNVGASYIVQNGRYINGIGSLRFNQTESSTTKSIDASEIKLSENSQFVEFRYSFDNFDDDPCKVTLDTTRLPTANNMDVSYVLTATTDHPQSYASLESIGGGTFIVEPSTRQYMWIKVSISNTLDDASYVGTLYWTLENAAST